MINLKKRPIIIIKNEKEEISNEKRKAVKDVPIFAPKIKANADFSLISFDDKKAMVMIIISIIVSLFYETFLSAALRLTTSIGDKYDLEFFTEGSMNILRIAVYLVVPILSYVYRNMGFYYYNPMFFGSLGEKYYFCSKNRN